MLTLTLNRPQRLNAMSNALIEAMNRELARARDDAAVRAVLLTGTGRGFCAGADLAGGGTGRCRRAKAAPDLGAGNGPPLQPDDPRHAGAAQADRRAR